MKRYCIKCESDRVEFLDIMRETETGFHVRIIRNRDGYETETDSFMERHLFEMCINTGFLFEMAVQDSSVA